MCTVQQYVIVFIVEDKLDKSKHAGVHLVYNLPTIGWTFLINLFATAVLLQFIFNKVSSEESLNAPVIPFIQVLQTICA